MTAQQKTRLSILHANSMYAATQLITFHKEHLVIIHQWRGRNIIESDEDQLIIERWQRLAFNYEEAKREALNFEIQLSSIRKYQKKEKEITARIPIYSFTILPKNQLIKQRVSIYLHVVVGFSLILKKIIKNYLRNNDTIGLFFLESISLCNCKIVVLQSIDSPAVNALP